MNSKTAKLIRKAASVIQRAHSNPKVRRHIHGNLKARWKGTPCNERHALRRGLQWLIVQQMLYEHKVRSA